MADRQIDRQTDRGAHHFSVPLLLFLCPRSFVSTVGEREMGKRGRERGKVKRKKERENYSPLTMMIPALPTPLPAGGLARG